MKRILDFFLSPYANDRIEVRRKAKILLVLLVIIFFILLSLGLLTFFTDSPAVGLIMIIFSGIFVLSVFLLRTGKLKLVVNIFLIIFVILTFCSMKFDEYHEIYDLYAYCAVSLFNIVITLLIGYNRFQAILITILSDIGLLSIYFIDTFPLHNFNFTPIDIQTIAITSVITTISGILGSYTMSIQKDLVHEAEKHAGLNKDRFEKLENVLKNTQIQTLSNGEMLERSSSSAVVMIRDISRNLEKISSQISLLNQNVDSTSQANHDVSDAAGAVKTKVTEYSQLVSGVSASIEEIAAAIKNLADNAQNKRETIDSLVQSARDGDAQVSASVDSIQKISQSTTGMLNIADLITDVATRTNLLALNASIEASHAGEAGKGFSVVAGEIRKLAEETTRNSKNITSNLKHNIEDIKNTVQLASGTGESFSRINNEVQGIVSLIEEVITGVEQMSVNAGDILKAVSDIMNSSAAVEGSLKHSQEMVVQSNDGIQKVTELSSEITALIAVIGEAFHEMMSEAEKSNRFVEENIRILNTLYEDIRKIELAGE